MVDPMTVLVVDDEQPLARIVGSYLEAEGFTVALAHDGPSAVEAARASDPDLVVLDVMMPGFDGIEACRRIRAFSDCYIIMLTARDEEIDKVVGLSVGADDYLVKPFSPRELVARVRAMLRRPRTRPATRNRTGTSGSPPRAWSWTPESRKAWRSRATRTGTHPHRVRPAGRAGRRPRRAFTRRQLIDDVWGSDWYGDEHIVDVHIGHLRRKLGDSAADPTFIRTVRGVGYGMGPVKAPRPRLAVRLMTAMALVIAVGKYVTEPVKKKQKQKKNIRTSIRRRSMATSGNTNVPLARASVTPRIGRPTSGDLD